MSPAAEPRGSGRIHAQVAGAADTAAGDRKDVGARAYPAGIKGLVERVKALIAWWQRTRAARANTRFGEAGGGVLTGGIAYAALFSVFAGLTIGYTAFMAVLGGNESLRQTVLDTVDANLPGLVDTGGDSTGLIDPDSLEFSRGLGIASIIAFVVLLMSAISAMAALRTAVRAIFDLDPAGEDNAVVGKLRQLGGFVGMGLAILLSAVLSIGTTTAADWLLGLVGLDDSTAGAVTVRVLGLLVAFLVDAATFCLIVILLSGIRPAWRDLRGGAIIAGVGLGVVRILGTSVVAGSASSNPLLTSFAVIVTLLVWMNLISRIVLLAAAWTADPPPPDEA